MYEPIYIKMSCSEVRGKIVIDLSKKNLVVQNDFIVSIEKVKDLGPGTINMCGNLSLGSAPMFMRISTLKQGFMKVPMIGMGMQAYVTIAREK